MTLFLYADRISMRTRQENEEIYLENSLVV